MKVIFLGIMFIIQLKEITLDETVVVSSLLSICHMILQSHVQIRRAVNRVSVQFRRMLLSLVEI